MNKFKLYVKCILCAFRMNLMFVNKIICSMTALSVFHFLNTDKFLSIFHLFPITVQKFLVVCAQTLSKSLCSTVTTMYSFYPKSNTNRIIGMFMFREFNTQQDVSCSLYCIHRVAKCVECAE